MFKKSNDWLGNPGQEATGICRNVVRKSDFRPTSISQIILSGIVQLSQLSPLSTYQSSKVSSIMSDVPVNNFLSCISLTKQICILILLLKFQPKFTALNFIAPPPPPPPHPHTHTQIILYSQSIASFETPF